LSRSTAAAKKQKPELDKKYSEYFIAIARQPRRGGYAQSYPQLGPSFPI
jgi:hypothetical protein